MPQTTETGIMVAYPTVIFVQVKIALHREKKHLHKRKARIERGRWLIFLKFC